MFQFRRFPPYTYGFSARWLDMTPAGLLHSDTHGSMPAYGSPWLFAVCCVLLRLPVPRHSPCALCSLTMCSSWFSKLVSYRDLLFEIVDFAFKILVFKYFRISSLYLLSLYSVFNVHVSLTIVKLWWRWTESNRWPPACKAGALPAELHPHILFRIKGIFSCARPYSPEVPFYRALKIKQRLQEANFVTDLGC